MSLSNPLESQLQNMIFSNFTYISFDQLEYILRMNYYDVLCCDIHVFLFFLFFNNLNLVFIMQESVMVTPSSRNACVDEGPGIENTPTEKESQIRQVLIRPLECHFMQIKYSYRDFIANICACFTKLLK